MKKFIALIVLLLSVQNFAQLNVPLQITDDGFIFLTASANDTIDGSFILDTGGGLEVISESFFNKVKATAKEYGVFTGFRYNGERIDLKLYQIPSLQIDNYKINNVIVGVYPLLDDYGFDGIISCKFFETQPFSIDFPNKELIIESSKSIRTIEENSIQIPVFVQPYGKIGLDIFMDVYLNEDIKLFAEFDTGHGYNQILINSYFKDKFKTDTTVTRINICLDKSIVEMNPKYDFKEKLIYDGLFGSKIFSSGILTIDIPSQKAMFRK